MKYDSSIKGRKLYGLQVSALPGQTALQCAKELLEGLFLQVWIQGVQVRAAGVAFRLH